MIAPLFDMFTGAMFIFSCEIPIYVQTKNRLAHLDQDYAGWLGSIRPGIFLQMKFLFFQGCTIKQAVFLPGKPAPYN